MKTAIILGTSRINGDTHQLVKLFQSHSTGKIFNLSDYDISAFDYLHKNRNDDFLSVMREILYYDHIIFASPMYWYSMSGQMKIFIDRFSDLLIIEQNLGRKFRGKTCSVLATGYDNTYPECFIQPFILTAEYLGMTYKTMTYCSCKDGFVDIDHIETLLEHINDIKHK